MYVWRKRKLSNAWSSEFVAKLRLLLCLSWSDRHACDWKRVACWTPGSSWNLAPSELFQTKGGSYNWQNKQSYGRIHQEGKLGRCYFNSPQRDHVKLTRQNPAHAILRRELSFSKSFQRADARLFQRLGPRARIKIQRGSAWSPSSLHLALLKPLDQSPWPH